MKLFSFRTLEYLLLLPFVILLAVVIAAFATYWLEDRPVFGNPQHLHQGLGIKVDGFPREFAAYVPRGVAEGQKLPLVIVLHPHVAGIRDVIGKGFVPLPEAVWMEIAEREKFIVIYPQGLIAQDHSNGWNDCRVASPANPVFNDSKFIASLISYAADKFDMDQDRVYVSGMSNGGFMALRVAQESAHRIAAAASASALMVRKSECRKKPANPVSVLFMYGDSDWITPEEGGDMPEGRGVLYSAEKSMSVWAGWNGLNGIPPTVIDVPDADPEDHVTATYTQIAAPDGGVAVASYRFEGQGHAAPSILMKQPWWMDALFGWQSHDIEMAEAMWVFFKDKRLQKTAQ